MRTAIINFNQLSQSELIVKTSFTTFCLTDNANFPTLPISLATITAKLAAWQVKLDLGHAGDHVAIQDAIVLRKELSSMLRSNGVYINETAKGNVSMLESSGYDLSKIPEKKPIPEIRLLQSGQTGSGKIVIEAVIDAVAYLIEYCIGAVPAPGNTNVWGRVPLTTCSYQNISGIEPGVLFHVRYCTVSTKGESPYSNPYPFRLL